MHTLLIDDNYAMCSAILKENMNSVDRVMPLLRLMIRAIDLHSRFLMKEIGMTTPQLLVLREVGKHGGVTPTRIALDIKLSKATVSGIIERLREKEYIVYTKNSADRRKIALHLTHDGWDVLEKNPLPIQQQFVHQFNMLHDEKKNSMLESLEAVALLMFQACSAANDDIETDNKIVHNDIIDTCMIDSNDKRG